MTKKKAYIYPVTARLKSGISNPYLEDFMDALEGRFEFVNRNHPSNKGILNIFSFLFKIDFLFLNWIEDLPDKFLGRIQTYTFIGILRFCKIRKIKIVWTLHNRDSHYKNNMQLKKKIIRELAKQADVVITHAGDGIDYAKELGISPGKIFFHHHPLKNMWVEKASKAEYDILIWGTITPYKGIHDFLEKTIDNSELRICVAGKIPDPEYKMEILKYQSANISVIDKFLALEDLKKLVAISKYILFTYQDESVLSSGALMDSIGFGAQVTGPRLGAFKDLAEEGVLMVYDDFNGIKDIITSQHKISEDKLMEFIDNNSWESFNKRFINFL